MESERNYQRKQTGFDDAVVDWVAEKGTLFYAVGTPGFKRVIKAANSKLVVKTPTYVSKQVFLQIFIIS